MSLLEVLTFLVYLVSGVTFILALKFLSSPRTARTGNLLGAAGMALVVIWTLATTPGMLEHWWIVLGLLLGGLVVIGILLALITNNVPLLLLFVAVALVTGVALVMPIGGADMPVVISLLNSYTGIAVAATGYVLGNYALLIAGTLVGASGAILTQPTCRTTASRRWTRSTTTSAMPMWRWSSAPTTSPTLRRAPTRARPSTACPS